MLADAAVSVAGVAGMPAGDGAGGTEECVVVAGTAPCAAAAFTSGPPVDSMRMMLPSDTLSPTLTLISRTLPLNGDGTSIVALSDSRLTSACSALTSSPSLTSTSITGTSLKSPISGTRTSARPAGAWTGAGGADTFGTAA